MTGEQVSLGAAEAFYRASFAGIRFIHDCGVKKQHSESLIPPVEQAPSNNVCKWLEDTLASAAAVWGPAFSPARVFQFSGLAAEEPFGPNWPVLPESIAGEILKDIRCLHFDDCVAALNAAAGAWNIEVLSLETGHMSLSPQTGLILAGPSAIAAAVKLFSERSDLEWGKQVIVVASRPDTRHIAGLAGLFVQSDGPTKLLSPNAAPHGAASPAYAVFKNGHIGIDEVLVSPDAEPLAVAFAQNARDGINDI